MRTLLTLLSTLALVPFLAAQTADKHDDTLQETQRLLDEPLIEAKQFRAVQFFAKSRDRLRSQRRGGRGDIDQVTVMRDDRRNPGLLQPSPEQRHLVTGQIASTPLTSGLREDLQRVAPAGFRAVDRARQPAGDRHVGPEEWHIRKVEG